MESTGVTHAVAVPRAWLIVLSVFVVAPWIVVAGLYLSGRRPAGEADRAGRPGPAVDATREAGAGPWGTLTVTPVVISPPLELVTTDWGPVTGPRWYFPGASPAELESFLQFSGLAPADAARVRATARVDPQSGALMASPDADLVRGLDREVRARIYVLLARSPLNFDQAQSFRFAGALPEAWLGGTLISPSTRALIEPLIYEHDGYMHFADLEVVRSQVRDPEELRRLAKALLRQPTVLVRLAIHDGSEVAGLVEYWGRGGRRTDLRPLLESVAGGGGDRTIDIAHLLPAFAREHLYRYPKLSTGDLDRPALANCLWTALNFFVEQPDDRFLDVDQALARLKSGYYVVEHGFQLGDIVALLDEDGDLFHVVVYLADDLVLTKNGTSPVAPWIILPMERVKQYYSTRYRELRLIYHRRNDL